MYLKLRRLKNAKQYKTKTIHSNLSMSESYTVLQQLYFKNNKTKMDNSIQF